MRAAFAYRMELRHEPVKRKRRGMDNPAPPIRLIPWLLDQGEYQRRETFGVRLIWHT